MKLILPDRTSVQLQGGKTYKERIQIIEELLDKHGKYYIETFDLPRTRIVLDVIANYLSRASDFKEQEYPVLSRRKQRDLECGTYDCIPFSQLSRQWRVSLGLVDINDDCE